jgi:alginate O-acetyltransferase complex protein AlgI
MVFNSWEFIAFFTTVCLIYWSIRNRSWQNLFLLIVSYLFYAAWDWRFLSLILISTGVDYISGIQIERHRDRFKKRLFLSLSITTNLGLLGFFKYFNFFVENLELFLNTIGLGLMTNRLNVILPVGISFYTFQTMSYTIDIYRGKLKPTRNLIDFALFVAFFPQLVAGPIERAKRLLPQIYRPRVVDNERLRSGLWLLFWGLYKKVVIADNMASIVESVFDGSATGTFLQAYLGVFAFAIQIFCDFSGYSDVARGCARILGFELMRNFDLPYVAKNPQDFWRRWHISLSTWLRDYLYISLGGNRKGPCRTYVNLFLTMLLGGLWHGAAWNFIWWGCYHGLLLIVHRLYVRGRDIAGSIQNRRVKALQVFVMFQFTLFGWLLFRSNRRVMVDGISRDDSFKQILEMVFSFQNGWGFTMESFNLFSQVAAYASMLVIMDWLQAQSGNRYPVLAWRSQSAKAFTIAALTFTMLVWGVQTGANFIYFQF